MVAADGFLEAGNVGDEDRNARHHELDDGKAQPFGPAGLSANVGSVDQQVPLCVADVLQHADARAGELSHLAAELPQVPRVGAVV